ncbi:MAG TPA: 3-hydroxyacyl-CoA dehydrogenase NAD-binding domain-containing protein [Thermoanaerobaculia bacterium]|nr:3-hydroxyacyl-CoA dehydrogenase NAD-binding domain-containing protein [Thermoanaerobaculia bacterium]
MSTSVLEERLTAPPHAPGPSFRFALEPDGLGLLFFDTPGEKVNKYSAVVLKELDGFLDGLAQRTELKALLLVSSKPDIFIAGADVNEIATAPAALVAEGVRFGQKVFGKLANLPYPTVAAIDGACLGGGCETALAMDWRLASDSKKTRIGLPEIKLGILPAWGGSTRLPRIVGLTGALDIILAGKTVDGKRARRMGLVDEVIPQPILLEEAKKYARSKFGTPKRSNAGAGGGPPRARPATTLEKLLESLGAGIVFRKAKAAVLKETKGHYPAPLEALEVVRKGFGAPLERGLRAEVEGVSKLVGTPVMRNLVNLFFRMEEVKKETGVRRGVKPRTVRRIGVLGAGVMGGGIAQLAADTGFPARMKDIRAEPLAGGFAQAAKIWKEQLKKRRMTKGEFASKMALLSGTLDYTGFSTCDVTIEAVLEKLSVKQVVLREWEGVVPETAIFASNTSTLPIAGIASAAARPERVVGMHFFNPVHKMPLVEVIYGEKTAPQVTATIFDLARRMGKTPVVVKDAPGFLVNRILAPYLGEAVRLLLEGADPAAVDRAARDFGMPVGPFELLDDVGIDVATKGAETLSGTWPERIPADPAFGKMVGAKRLGRKSGKGFYLYEGDHRKGSDPSVFADLGLSSPSKGFSASQIEERLLLPMVNEAAFCLADGIVESPAKLDLAMIFGTGFPPFRGGLCAWADSLGAGAVVDGLERLVASKGTRFAPAPLLVELARSGKRFVNPES